MSSPRLPPRPLNLAPQTFGDAPAALYLAEILNQLQDRALHRSVARLLSQAQTLLADLARAHLDHDALSTRSLAQLLPLLSAHYRALILQVIGARNSFVANLTVNVLEGQLKTWKNRAMRARQREKQRSRIERGAAPYREWVPATAVVGEKNADALKARSKSYLQRKGKKDTLY